MKKIGLWRLIGTTYMVVFMAVVVAAGGAKAQAGRGFTISPPVFELSANPGEDKEEVVSLYNQGDSDLVITTSVEDMRPFGEAGQVQLVPNSGEEKLPSLKDWITVSKKSVSLSRGATDDVKFSVNLPANAPPGGHFASVVFSSSGGQVSESGTSVANRIGALVLLTVSGDIKKGPRVWLFLLKRAAICGATTRLISI